LKTQEQNNQQSIALPPAQPSVNELKKEKEPLTMKKTAALCCVGGGTLCLGITSYFYIQIVDNQNKYLNTSNTKEINTYRERKNSSAVFAIVSVTTAVLFAGGATILFVIDKNELENNKGISLSPLLGECNGLVFTLSF
jgi:hypothetical protein